MLSPYLEFLNRLDEMGQFLSEHDPASTTIRKRFEYASVITLSYAVYETYVERVCAAGLAARTAIIPYDLFEERVKTKHLYRSAELIQRGRLGEGRYANLSPEIVIANLNSCLSGQQPYTVTEDAIVAHDANLRWDELGKLFGDAGVSDLGKSICRHPVVLDWYREVQDFQATEVAPEVVKSWIDDLVERRNELSHRGTTDNLLSPTLLGDYVGLLRSIGVAIVSRVAAVYLGTRIDAGGFGVPLTITEGPYLDGEVVVVSKPPVDVAVGQPIFALDGSGLAFWGSIESLRVDDHDVQVVPAGAPVSDVGIRLPFRYRSGELYVAASPDYVLWPIGA